MIVFGTGLEESMVAASAARNGHSVLHVDTNDYYGETWAAFNFDGMQKWIEFQQKRDKKRKDNFSENEKNSIDSNKPKHDTFLNENETLLDYSHNAIESNISDVSQQWHISKEILIDDSSSIVESSTVVCSERDSVNDPQISNPVASEEDLADSKLQDDPNENNENIIETPKEEQLCKKNRYLWNKEKILNSSRYFNLDLMPRLLFAHGAMVDLLISSNISRYTEFKVSDACRDTMLDIGIISGTSITMGLRFQ